MKDKISDTILTITFILFFLSISAVSIMGFIFFVVKTLDIIGRW